MASGKERRKIEALAEKLARKGKVREAIEEYKKLLEGDEKDIEVRNKLGELYFKIEQEDDAAEEFLKIASHYEEKGLYAKAIAILKRINRLLPGNIKSGEKLADLYHNQGYVAEAKTEYSRLAEKLTKKKRFKEAIFLYEKLLKLDREDLPSRLVLADLYAKEGETEEAIGVLNDAAEYKLRHNLPDELEEILQKARALKDDHPRTLTNLLEFLKREDKKKEALELIHEILKKDKENIKALYALGQYNLEDHNIKKAEEVFNQILAIRPKEANTAVMLGKIYIQRGQIDQAFELYEPLVDTLIRKQKEAKAIGLLGLTLASGKKSLPVLEKLMSIYKSKAQKKNVEIVSNILLAEYKRLNLKEKTLSLLNELVSVFPDDVEYLQEFRKIKKEMGIEEEGKEIIRESLTIDEAEEIIEADLAKAELYVEQGLIRNAKRILENLRIRFPGEPQVEQRLEKLKEISTQIGEEELLSRLEKVSEKESEMLGETIAREPKKPSSHPWEELAEEKISSADIFAETDIIPLVPPEHVERKYYNLSENIQEELEAIKIMRESQIKGDTETFEKKLSEIVSEFRKSIDEKVGKEAYESHYNLGITFLEQDLYDEAIKEFNQAMGESRLAVESFSLLSLCYRRKGAFEEALSWIDKALEKTGKKSTQFYALLYDKALILEDMGDSKKVKEVYKTIQEWNPEYRDIPSKLEDLENKTKSKK